MKWFSILLPLLLTACCGSIEIKHLAFQQMGTDCIQLRAELDTSLRKEYPRHLLQMFYVVLDPEAAAGLEPATPEEPEALENRAFQIFKTRHARGEVQGLDYNDASNSEPLENLIQSGSGYFKIVGDAEVPPFNYDVFLPIKSGRVDPKAIFERGKSYVVLFKLWGKIPTFGIPPPFAFGHPLDSNVAIIRMNIPD